MAKHPPKTTIPLRELEQIAKGLAATFAPFCEVVVHDLTDPNRAIIAIHNNLSGRAIGEPATELGLARIEDPKFPEIVANYSNQFPDGRQAKSTSIGIKDSRGHYVAALCLNIDLTLLRGLQSAVDAFASVDMTGTMKETLQPLGAESLRARIDEFAARVAATPRSLKASDRRKLVQELKESGQLEVRRAMEIIAAHLGVSRATIYADAK